MFKRTTILILAVISLLCIAAFAAATEVDTRSNATYTHDYSEDALNEGSLVPVDVYEVKINGDVVNNGDDIRTSIDRDSTLQIRIKLKALADADDVEIMAWIAGDEHHTPFVDSSKTFDVEEGVLYTKELMLNLDNLVQMDNYKLRIMVSDRYGASKVYNYNLKIEAGKHAVMIRDVTFSPSAEVVAGKGLITTVRVKNVGLNTEDSIKVTVSMPELGISATDYIDELESEDSVSSEEMYLRVPACAEAGTYTVRVTVDYDDGFEQVSKDFDMDVAASDTCGAGATQATGKTIVTIGSQEQDITKGTGVVYPITLTNTGSTTKTYSVTVDGASWADVTVSPSNVIVLEGGETETVYLYVSAKDTAKAGEQMFSININSGSETLKQIPLKANIKDSTTTSSWSRVKTGLEIALIVLIIILIIVALVIGFSRMKGNDEEAETQTYY